MKAKVKAYKLKWSFDEVATIGNTIVGSVSLGASGDWYGYGMLEEWEDTPLGSFKTYFQARRAVTRWIRENEE